MCKIRNNHSWCLFQGTWQHFLKTGTQIEMSSCRSCRRPRPSQSPKDPPTWDNALSVFSNIWYHAMVWKNLKLSSSHKTLFALRNSLQTGPNIGRSPFTHLHLTRNCWGLVTSFGSLSPRFDIVNLQYDITFWGISDRKLHNNKASLELFRITYSLIPGHVVEKVV